MAVVLLASFLAAGCGLSARANDARRELVVAVRTDAPPFGWRGEAGAPLAGFDVDLARALVAQLAGADAGMRLVPPAAAAEADLSMGRPPGSATTRPYLRQPLALLVRRGSPVTGLKDLDGRQLALVQGAPGMPPRPAGIRYVPEMFSTYPLALAAVGEGRADALAGELPVLRALATLDPNRRVIAAGYGETAYAVGASQRLLPQVDVALARLMADTPEWTRRLRRWKLG